MDVDGRKAEFVRAVEEAQRIMAGMLAKTQTNDQVIAQSHHTIQESRDLLRAPFDSGQ